ncbi:HECT-type E3 ubiquitin transferase [Heracleum sosnowskyi]|uniref:HECT-type E3 ubiquitin transferase n=1 Tax=Heracleum sosnowskyi TaxID=360622 RepID=A0AAD8N3T3_9APIA|nr:HECT-type E3 ubiquitin transferase [Heracleum sosnowskyi]
METRSRKRAEATSSAPNSSSSGPTTRSAKRTRTSAAAGSSASIASPVTPAIVTRSRSLKMEESSGSASRGGGRRGKNVEKDSSNKGKEKEHEVRIRERNRESRDIERSLGLNIESTGNGGEGNDDDNDSEDGVGMLQQNLTSASSALQGLLRKLGAGLDDLLPSSAMAAASSSQQSGRLKKILLGLEADGEEGKQVEALTQLCEILSIGTEDSLSTFSVDSFVPVLVNMLTYMENADIMLLAARAITHLCDVLPSSCTAVVHFGAVDSLVNKLLTIEYMDLAEQSLQALKKISQEHPTACLRAGALMAVLQYLDFFSTGVQRVALTTAANMCKKLPADAAEFVTNAVPLLSQLLQEHDAKVIELASICLTRIVESFASSPDRLDELCNHGLITQVASLISTSSSGGGQATLSTSTYTGLVRLLSTCASGSPLGSKNLLLLGISGIIKDILSGSGLVANMSVSPALSSPPEQIFEIVNLANELLPPLPQGTISLPSSSNVCVKGSLINVPPVDSEEHEEQADSIGTEISTREKLLNEQPELLQQFGMDILPVLIQIYGSSVNGPVRHKCLSVIGKLMYFSSADMIQGLLSVTNISSFLAGVLAWKDPQVLVPALQIADILMNKLPETFSKIFVREGVVHAVDTLILAGSQGAALPQESSCLKENDSVPGSSSRSRRNRRRGGNLNLEGNTAEDPKHSGSAVGSPPNPVEIPTVNSSLRTEVSSSAQAFKDKYFPSDPGSVGGGLSDDLLHLKSLCSRLNAGVSNQGTKTKGKSKASGPSITDTSASKEENLAGIISEILTELSKGDGVSTFEFIGSGVVAALLNYLSCGFSSKEKISKSTISKYHEQAMRRYKSFIAVALPSGPQTKNVPPMSILVQKLQNALSSLERFPVVLSQTARSSGGNVRMSSGLSALVQPFKLRLCRAQGEKSLRDYSSNVVLIDPLASLATVEDFLWPRVQRNESGQKPLSSAAKSESKAPTDAGASSPSNSTPASMTRRQSTRSRTSINIGDGAKKELASEKNASSSKGKGKAVLRTTQEDGRGPHTRKAARRKAAVDKDVQMKAVEVESSSEDEDLEASPVEVDDEMVIEDDDISDDEDDDDQDDVLGDGSSRVCMMDVVHDVKLGDLADDGSNAPSISDKQVNTAGVSSSRTTTLRSSESSDLRSGTAFGSRGAMSFAAAAMAGLSSSNNRGISATREQPGRPQVSPRLLFSAGGKHLNKHLPIYQAIQRQLVLDEDEDERYNGNDFISSDGSRLWGDIYTITYKRADSQTERASVGTISSSSPSKSRKGVSASSSSIDSSKQRISLLDSIFRGELPCDLEKSNPTYDILALLRVLEGLNELAPRLRIQSMTDSFSEGNISSFNEFSSTGVWVPSEEFINTKLTPKLARQLQDALALCSGSLPSWCYQLTKACPFLFPFETRRQYFYSTAFGLSRALYRLQQQQGADGHGSMNEREVRVGRLQRQKVRVSRNRILDSAAKVMEMYCSQKAVLEVEYFGEVGTGLGPTLEFYTILSRDLQKVGLKMWRSNSSSDKSMMEVDEKSSKKISYTDLAIEDIIQAPLGLFPRPWLTGADVSDGSKLNKVVEHFRLLGRVLAKALQDGRLLDLPLSTAFYKILLGQDLDLHDIITFDAELGKTLVELQALVYRKKYLESVGASDQIADLRYHGALIEDLCLDFTLPGYPDYILKPGEENVDINNLEEYVTLVVDATVGVGIRRQLEALKAGFSQVFDITSLQIFTAKELDYLLCGRRELWETETLADHIKFDHGYTAKSPPIVNLLEIMGEFTPEQQRAFCQFVTGAPRLPPGGLAVLNPKLTIVRKHSSSIANTTSNGTGASEFADDDLPSVMTCANYLKLPPYSTKEVMYKKLMYAISEGQGSFDLS